MKKLFLLLILMFFIYSAKSQTELFPRDINGNVYFSEIVQVENVTKEALHLKFIKSSNNVIQFNDKENGIIIGKGYTDVYAKSTIRDGVFIILDFTATVKMWFTIKIQCKDSRYKYEIYDIYFTGNSQYSGRESCSIEYAFDSSRLTSKKKVKKILTCKHAVDKKIINLITNIKSSIKKDEGIEW